MIKNILLAEDDRGTALVVRTQLESKGYKVLTAGNGIEAMRLLGSNDIDLIITDVVMPEMDGVDLYREVKGSVATADIPVIIVTDKTIFKESFAALGVSHFVEKSGDISHLLEKITHIETEENQIKEYHKVLISGGHTVVLEKMRAALQSRKCLVSVAHTSAEIMANALTMSPHVIILDGLYQDNVATHEVIRSLRTFGFMKNAKIYVYAFFFPEELGIDVGALQSMEEQIKMCLQAGADEYIGRFNQSYFIQKLVEWGM